MIPKLPTLALAGLVLGLSGCGNDLRTYETPLFRLGTGYNAKEACSCIFVSERTEEDCQEWLRVSPDVARFKVDHEAKTVTSKALGGAKTVVAYVDEREGCIMVD